LWYQKVSEYKTEGDCLYTRAYPFERWKLLLMCPDPDQRKLELEASDALYESGTRADWQALLRRTFPDAKLCNCGEAFYGCKYGCGWARSKAKEAVAAKILRDASRVSESHGGT
jgi:hypothetical protein